MNPWSTATTVTRHRGGRVIVPRQHAPLARALPYRRAAGEHPSSTGGADLLKQRGWSVVLPGGFGDALLALGLVRALADATGHDDELQYDHELQYVGPRPRLMQRCTLPLRTRFSNDMPVIHTKRTDGLTFLATPEKPPAWLDLLDDDLDDGLVEVHASLPMRYYLATEQVLGVRLPADRAPITAFTSGEAARPFHVVFVSATSWSSRKDYGADGFARIARILAERVPASWTFTLIPGTNTEPVPHGDFETLVGLDAVDCLDVFASAEIVIGNDTGLTHLAALTDGPNRTGPHVIGLYGRHAHTKWTTGSDRHHAIATPFSHMLALADRCPVRDHLDDTLWSRSANLADIPPQMIADFACDLVSWERPPC